MKTCIHCTESKPLSEFHKKNDSVDGHRARCKICINRQVKEYEQDPTVKEKRNKYFNSENFKSKNRESKLRRKYNISQSEYSRLLDVQNQSCAICKKHKSEFKISLAVDHCHTTGKVRGLLCKPCNLAIGNFEDQIESLKNAINYLTK